MRNTRIGIGSAAALALLAGTAIAQQSQDKMDKQHKDQMHTQLGQSTQYRQSDDWRSTDFVQELSDTIVILKSDDADAQVNIIHGQVEAKLDGEKLSSGKVEKKGDKLRVLNDDDETVAEFTLPDLQMIRQASLNRGGMQQRQFGAQDDRDVFGNQSQLRDRQFGTQEQWRDDWRQQENFRQQNQWRQQDNWNQQDNWRQQQDWNQQDNWRQNQNRQFQDNRSFQDDDWRFRNLDDEDRTWRSQQRFQDDRSRSDRFDTDRQPMMTDQYRPEPSFERPHRSGQYRASESFHDDRYGTQGGMHSGMRGMGGQAEHKLGISLAPAPSRELRQTRHQQGMIIEHIQPNSPLAGHGLRSGDIIVEVDGRPATHSNLERTVNQLSDRDTFEFTAVRNGQPRTFNLRGSEITMGGMGGSQWDDQQRFQTRRFESSDTYQQGRFQDDRRLYGSFESDMNTPQIIGIQVDEARSSDLRNTHFHTGTEVVRVLSNSPADRAGLRSGDIIVEINGRGNVSPTVLHRELSRNTGEPLNIMIVRDDRERNINLRTDTFDNRRFGTDQRFDDMQYRSPGQYRRPSDQEDLFRLPGQVPPGPDSGVYQPRYEDRQNEWGDFYGDRNDYNSRGTTTDRRWDTFDRRNDYNENRYDSRDNRRNDRDDRWDW